MDEFACYNYLIYCIYVSLAEYNILCPGGEGFKPNPITIILEGNQPVIRLTQCTVEHTFV